MLRISSNVTIPDTEIVMTQLRASGPGGQHVNKVSTAIQLRFDSLNSSLPSRYKNGLMAMRDRRITAGGIVVIKSQRYRSQERNREDALERLRKLILRSALKKTKRIATRPTAGSRRRRLDTKTKTGKLKALRGKVKDDH